MSVTANTRLQRTIRPGILELQWLGLLAAEAPCYSAQQRSR